MVYRELDFLSGKISLFADFNATLPFQDPLLNRDVLSISEGCTIAEADKYIIRKSPPPAQRKSEAPSADAPLFVHIRLFSRLSLIITASDICFLINPASWRRGCLTHILPVNL